ncbi:Maleate isomerase [Roseobacter fucihabitans]|uniref:Maleate isomerase n=1 Tax=Roseobacter fucihabitans TaxID=1537242 RepID=A0ABZ2BT00_9RHOB|nr:aspartate/glutamate racemase family protein [Roseobacter litoralis]MBC6966644.1 Arylmalonate decarboxylase [Roseobacter litoralis]
MASQQFPYVLDTKKRPQLGLIVLQSDVTLEDDMRQLLPASVSLHVSRVPSAQTVTAETLAQMEDHLAAAAGLFPRGLCFDMLGYGCTSGTAQIGASRIAQCLRQGTQARQVSEPLSALVTVCGALDVTRIAFLSPYIESVSNTLRETLAAHGIQTPAFGSFCEEQEARVAQIDSASIYDATCRLAEETNVQAVFLSCTNLRTLEVIPQLSRSTGLPILSSNLVLAWHMLQATGAIDQDSQPGDLL